MRDLAFENPYGYSVRAEVRRMLEFGPPEPEVARWLAEEQVQAWYAALETAERAAAHVRRAVLDTAALERAAFGYSHLDLPYWRGG
jgi:hypothetical protein